MAECINQSVMHAFNVVYIRMLYLVYKLEEKMRVYKMDTIFMGTNV